jgi:protoheme ferro-lyase
LLVQILNISIALIVFMGLVSGGMLALVLMTTRRYQLSFSVVLLLAVALAVTGVFTSVAYLENLPQGLANAVILLVLSFALGYALTTFSVLSYSNKRKAPARAPSRIDSTVVIQLAPGEPPDYGVESASRRLALADDPQDVPPVLLRPFYLRDLRSKYARIERSPYREYHNELARKVQSRLDSSHQVYAAFYSDQPSFASVLSDAIESGARRVVVAHVRVTDPPDPVKAGDLREGLNPANYGVQLVEIGPLWDSDLLPQIYARRALEAAPQMDTDPGNIGLLLVGRGHLAPDAKEQRSSDKRYRQESDFQNKVRQALVKVGFDESRVAIGWLRSNGPTVAEALQSLISMGCKSVLWLPSAFSADGVNTLCDIPTQIDPIARRQGIKLASLGAWNADDLTAEDIAARVRAVTDATPSPALSQNAR